jgi:hypothetical protein
MSFFKACDMYFRQYLNGSWAEIPFPSLTINDVPFTIRNEPYGIKNKVVKHWGQKYI